jgi:hypothetical protein
MSNLIDRDEVIKILENTMWSVDWYHTTIWISVIPKILSLPLQQQWGNENVIEFLEQKLEKYKELGKQKKYEVESIDRQIWICWLINDIKSLPHNN